MMRRYMKQILAMICMLFCAGLLMQMPVYADETTGGTEGDAPQAIEYTVKKVKEKIMMIPGEQRMVTLSIPGDSTFVSSNPKVVAVSNMGQAVAMKAGTAKITHTTGTTKATTESNLHN